MFGYATLLWPLIAGIYLYAGLLHLQNGLRRPVDRVHTSFGFLALSMFVVVLANTQLTSAQNAAQYQLAAWIFTFSWLSVFVLLPWFVTYYAGEPRRAPAAVLSAIYLLVLIANFFQLYSILLSMPPVLHQVEYAWGEQMTRSATTATFWYRALWVPHLLTVAYLIYAAVGLFLRGPRGRAWGLALSAGPFAVSLLVNVLIRFHVINFPYVAAPGFLALIIVMSVVLTRELRRAQSQMQILL